GVDSTKVYRYDMQTTLGEVVEYDLSGLGITKVQNITVSHPTSSQTILYVTDSEDSERVSAFDISTGTPTPVSMTTVNSADEVFVGRDINGDQIVHFVDDSTMYTMSDLTATNSFMSALNMSEDSGTAGKDLIGSLNGVEFQRNANENRDLLSGVTLNFKGTTNVGSPISVTVEPDSDSVVESVKSFVDQYNQTETALRQAVNAQRIFNPRTEEELTQGVLANDTMLRSLMMRLSSISSLPVVGTGAVKRLGDLGINRGRAGSVSIDQIKSGLELKLDEGKLRSAISANPEGAASVFGSISSLGTKAHRPVPKDTETTVTVSSANYSLLETKIGKQVLIKNGTTGATVPMTLSGVNSSGKQLNLTSGTFSTADYSGYQLELLVDNTQPWHSIPVNSTTPNSTNKETVLKINDGGTINTLKDQQNLNRVANKLNSAVDLQLKTTLGSDISNSATSITLSDASRFSDSGTIVVSQINSGSLQYEVMNYTSKSGNTLSGLTRGVDVNTTYTTSPTAFTTSNSAKVAQTLFTVNVTDVDMDESFVTVGSYLDTDIVNPSNSTIVSVDGTTADITMTSIEQSAANRSLMKVAPGLIKDFSIGSRLRLKQGNKTNDFNILTLDTNRVSGFNSKTMPPAGGSNGNITKSTNTSGKITTTSGSSGTTVMTVWADDLRSFIGRSRVLLSNGTQDEEATINSIDSNTRLLSDYTNSTLFVTGGSTSQAGITAASSLFNAGLNLGTGSNKGKFEVHVGDAVNEVDLFGGSYTVGATISLSTLASRINSVSGVSASVTDSNYIRVEADSSVAGVNSDTPIVITGKYTSASNYGINLFSPTNRNEDLIKFSGIAEVTLNTPANVPNLTGFNTIKAAYNDTMLVQGSLPTMTTGDLLVEGVAESTENTLAAYTRLSTGIIGKRLQNIVSQAKRVYEDMDTFDDKIRQKELKLLREYGSLEAALGETQVQSQYLTAQLANLQSTAQSISKRKK
ncbi:MAG: flagellar filament capping protein FliD, partial [Candidatus Poribacteria bacterium]|nr:flagellar filament capping protein FliD [Candidatus Poribacteria bacterium]